MSNKSGKTDARKYQFVVGVNLATLETDVNRLVAERPGMKLNQVLYVQGTGFIGVMEHAAGGVVNDNTSDTVAVSMEIEKKEEPKKNHRRSSREITIKYPA